MLFKNVVTNLQAVIYNDVHHIQHALQMFIAIYRVFTGKSECGDFKFTGIACYLQSLQSFLSKNNNNCREYDLYGYYGDSPYKS